jgi:hypothetical protein
VDGRAWIDELPASVAPRARVLRRLLDAVEADERFRALELQCSLARGNADELSDLDLRLHAACLGAPYPEFGVTSILDVHGADVPSGLAGTYARADADDVRRAALALARLLEDYDPPPLAAWARERLD